LVGRPPPFRGNMPFSSKCKTKMAGSSETLINTNQTTRCRNPEDQIHSSSVVNCSGVSRPSAQVPPCVVREVRQRANYWKNLQSQTRQRGVCLTWMSHDQDTRWFSISSLVILCEKPGQVRYQRRSFPSPWFWWLYLVLPDFCIIHHLVIRPNWSSGNRICFHPQVERWGGAYSFWVL
jgi:hypothetical protein